MIKQLDIFYPCQMGEGWVLVEFRLYRLHSTDSPAPKSKKVSRLPFMRERVIKILWSLFRSEFWFEVPQVKNTNGQVNYFSFVSMGEKGVQYNDLINKEFSGGDNDDNPGIGFFGSGVGKITDFIRVSKSGLPGLFSKEHRQD